LHCKAKYGRRPGDLITLRGREGLGYEWWGLGLSSLPRATTNQPTPTQWSDRQAV
jgi:hypothetical protein